MSTDKELAQARELGRLRLASTGSILTPRGELVTLLDALDRVVALHVVSACYSTCTATTHECEACPNTWPCPTIRALRGEQ